MLTPFVHCLQLSPIHVAFEDIVPALLQLPGCGNAPFVYKGLIHQWPYFPTDVVQDGVESRLRPYRQPAWEGHLAAEDCRDLRKHDVLSVDL
jgi:hypothetical protein